MSSHHIIRDEQEPPIFVFQINDNWEQLSEILGWSPILLVNPLLKDTFELRQIKVDGFLIENFTNSNFDKMNFVYQDLQLVDSLVKWIVSKKITALNIFCNNHVMMDLFQLLKNKSVNIPFIFFTENGKFILKPNSKFKKWYPEKFEIDILNEDIKIIKNLKQVKDGYSVERDGFVIIEIEGDLILLKEK